MNVFEVRGSGNFPLDMLRYDECFPASERESANMAATGKRVVALCTGKKFAPNTARWASFGWSVVYQDDVPYEKPTKDEYKDLIEYALIHGKGIEVQDPEWQDSDEEKRIYMGKDDETISIVQEEVDSWDGGQDFIIVHEDGARTWVGLAIGYGNEPWEQVYDYNVHPFMEEWSKQYREKYRDE